MLAKSLSVNYGDLGNPILTVQINGVDIPNVLVDMGATINVITSAIVITLGLRNLKPTPTVLELADQSTIRSVGKLEDITISVNSWQYPLNILVLHTQSPASGHPLILVRPWLVTADACIGCRSRYMLISNGEVTKKLILYPPAEPSSPDKLGFTLTQNSLSARGLEPENEEIRPILTIGEALYFKYQTENDAISTFINNPNSVSNSNRPTIMSCNVQEAIELESKVENVPVIVPHNNIPIEIEPGKSLNVNPDLSPSQSEWLLKVLREQKEAFSWEYTDIKGISANLCTHHIYIKEECRPVWQPQRRMNPTLKNIIKDELQNSQWVSPLVIVPKKNGK